MKTEVYTYCDRLRELRENKGWSTSKAAKKFNIPKTTYISYEKVPLKCNGNTTSGREVKIEFLLKACEIYEVTLDYLCGRSKEQAPTINEAEIVKTYGLLHNVLEILKQHQASNHIYNKSILEFINIGIGSVDFSCMINLSMDYINEYILWHDEIQQAEEVRLPIFRSENGELNKENEDLERKAYKLTKKFDGYIQQLIDDPIIKERIKKLYQQKDDELDD
jgi:transcriptional regulator with XRE-family HTH domain